MNIKFEKIPETMTVDCRDHGAGPFSVLIVPTQNEHIKNLRNFYLIHDRFGVVHYMFGCGVDDDTEAAEIAFYNAPGYIPRFLEECFENE